MNQRQKFAETVTRLMDGDPTIVVLTGDISVYGLRDAFSRWPKRCYNLGPAEQSLVGIAAGMAMEGFYPVVHSISSFLCRRAYEQIYIDFGAQGLAGLFVGIGEYPKLGPTHCCPEDGTLMGCVPGMVSYFPANSSEAETEITVAVMDRQLAYVRLS